MSHTPISPSDLQRIYLLYTVYIQRSHPLHYKQNEDNILCKKTSKKRSTN